jgi:hypothetical protein
VRGEPAAVPPSSPRGVRRRARRNHRGSTRISQKTHKLEAVGVGSLGGRERVPLSPTRLARPLRRSSGRASGLKSPRRIIARPTIKTRTAVESTTSGPRSQSAAEL